ncbi:MAG: HPF/RaiA family ribosome-associated protein [Arenimonas sp.]
MQILINTDHNVHGDEAFTARMSTAVTDVLERVAPHITRIELHLSVEGSKGARDDKRCVMEARLERFPPFAVTEQASNLDLAVHNAAHKMLRLIDSTLGRIREQHAGERMDATVWSGDATS